MRDPADEPDVSPGRQRFLHTFFAAEGDAPEPPRRRGRPHRDGPQDAGPFVQVLIDGEASRLSAWIDGLGPVAVRFCEGADLSPAALGQAEAFLVDFLHDPDAGRIEPGEVAHAQEQLARIRSALRGS